MEFVLKVLKDGLSEVHVPYAYGFAIILLTIVVKVATLPLTKKQVESTLAMQNLQPKIKAIQQRYAGNQVRLCVAFNLLYSQLDFKRTSIASVFLFNTGMAYGAEAEELLISGCFPTLATIPVWIGLYQALSNVANEGLLTEGFFWIPSLGGPTSIAARQSGSGISWLFPFVFVFRINFIRSVEFRSHSSLESKAPVSVPKFSILMDLVDGHPPLGWQDTAAYLVLPVLLIVSQYVSMEIMKPPQTDDPTQKNTLLVFKFLPLMIGYFSLSVPSGLSIYWFTNNVLSTAQQVWLRKLGGAKPVVNENASGIITAGRAKRSASQPGQSGDRFKLKEQGKKLAKALPTEGVQALDAASGSDEDSDDETNDKGEEVLEEAYASSASKGVPDISRPKRSKRSKRKRAHCRNVMPLGWVLMDFYESSSLQPVSVIPQMRRQRRSSALRLIIANVCRLITGFLTQTGKTFPLCEFEAS
ncbi:hypothetical protein DKX38_024625 [Salix brachista]|uniref:Membrane insertase YidC/Oxa/ALB C-terminal domain-containing protein n=1 Tax=Salix brachista TaxID=2182728 RepID=A0A5N5JNP7_9ROSI|nr:hypothetical protein DKX38_024625 [Salix brachista]